MKQIIFIFILFIFFSVVLLVFSNNVLAAQYTCGENGPTRFNSLDECRNPPSSCTNCVEVITNTPSPITNPLTGKTTYNESTEGIPVLLGKIINSVMGIIGSLALVMFIYGGATWMLSAGNQEQVTRGKNTLIWAAIGLVIIFTAYALVKFVLTTVTT